MKLRKMLSMATIAMFSIATPVALAQDTLLVPNSDGSTTAVDPLIRSSDPDDKDEGGTNESSKENRDSQNESTAPSESESEETSTTEETSSTEVEAPPVAEVAFTMQNGVQYIDLTCGMGESIVDHQEVFGTPGVSCDINANVNSGSPEDGKLIVPEGERITPETQDGGESPEESQDKPEEAPEETPEETPEDTPEDKPEETPKDTPQEPEPDKPEPQDNNSGSGGNLIVPEGERITPDEPSNNDSKDEDSPKDDVDPDDVQKELNNLGDAAESGMSDYLKASPIIFEEHHDDVVMLMSMIAASEDGVEKIEGLVKDSPMLADWMNNNAQAISDKMNQDIDDQVAALPGKSESMGLSEKDVEDIVETFESIKSMMGGNND